MGKLQQDSPMLRIWGGEREKDEYDVVAVLVYRDRLPGVSFEKVRKDLAREIEKIARNSPYSYWVSPKARSWLEN
jgi:hypothetical protein